MGVQVLAHPSAIFPRRPLRHSCTFVLLEHMCSDELVALLDRLLDEGSSCGCLTECHCHARSDLLTVGHAACVVPVHGDVLAFARNRACRGPPATCNAFAPAPACAAPI